MLSVLTETPGITAPMQANILPPTFQASCPPPQGSDTSAPGNVRQMAFTISRLIASPWRQNTEGSSEKPAVCLLCANSVLAHCSKQHSYSITSSARARSAGEISRPSALAVLTLITSPNLVGCWTGKSPDL